MCSYLYGTYMHACGCVCVCVCCCLWHRCRASSSINQSWSISMYVCVYEMYVCIYISIYIYIYIISAPHCIPYHLFSYCTKLHATIIIIRLLLFISMSLCIFILLSTMNGLLWYCPWSQHRLFVIHPLRTFIRAQTLKCDRYCSFVIPPFPTSSMSGSVR